MGKWYAKFRTVVNFVPESRLPFVQISSIYRKTAAKAWNRYQRRLWRNGTLISVWNIPPRKTGLPFQMFRCSCKFSAGTTQKVVFHSLSNWIFRTILVNGKQTISLDSSWKFLPFILQLLCSQGSVPLSLPNVAPFWSNETTVIPKTTLRNQSGNGTRVFHFWLGL